MKVLGFAGYSGSGKTTLLRIIAAPSVMRRRAAPRLVAPQTNGTVNFHLSMWWT